MLIINQIIQKLVDQKHLDAKEMRFLMQQIITGSLDEVSISSALTALKIKKETNIEVAASVQEILQHAKPFPTSKKDFVDIVGTGGDHANTFNISTTSAIVAASMGFPVIKHGNRSVSSQSGSSDLLTALQIKFELNPEQSHKLFDKFQLCFLHAPIYHQGFKNVSRVRQVLQMRTIFNMLGPLLNPARPQKMLIGVYSSSLLEIYADVLIEQGVQQAIVLHGSGTDEVALHGDTEIIEINHGVKTKYIIQPADFGVKIIDLDAIKGGNPDENRHITESIFKGIASEPQKQIIACTVALVMRLFGQDDIKQNTTRVMQEINSGKIESFFKNYQEGTQHV